jgi:hypothetical protein
LPVLVTARGRSSYPGERASDRKGQSACEREATSRTSLWCSRIVELYDLLDLAP